MIHNHEMGKPTWYLLHTLSIKIKDEKFNELKVIYCIYTLFAAIYLVHIALNTQNNI